MEWLAWGNAGFFLIVPAIVALYLLKRQYENIEVPSTLLWQQMLHNLEVQRPWQKLRRNLLLLLQLLAAVLIVLAMMKPAVTTDGAIARHTVIVIDNSGSMLAKEGEETRLSRAKQEVREWVEKLGSGQTVTLVEAGREPRVLVSKSGDKSELLAALQSISPRLGTSDANAALSLARAVALTERESGIVWVGDGGAGQVSQSVLETLSPEGFRFSQVGREKQNLAIGAFVTQKREDGIEGLVRIDNFGTQSGGGKVSIYGMDGSLVEAAPFTVEPRASEAISFAGLPAQEAYRAVIDTTDDALQEDNEVWSVPFAGEQSKVALVSPAGSRFLAQALQTTPLVQVEKRNAVSDQAGKRADVWVFDGVVPDKLPDGNVLLVSPDRKTEWLPYTGMKEAGQPLEAVAPEHPLLRYVDWRQVHVAKLDTFGRMPGMTALVRSGQDDVVAAGTLQERRVVIVGFDLHNSDFPLRPAFPIFMQNVLAWLAPAQSAPIGTAYAGELLNIPLTPGADKRFLLLPDGKTQAIEAEGTIYPYRVPERVGLYRLTEQAGGDETVRYFSVQMKETESDIAPQTIAVAAKTDTSGEGVAGQPEHSRSTGHEELTIWLMAAALAAVFAEWKVFQRGY